MCILSIGFHFKNCLWARKVSGLSRNEPLARRVDQVSVTCQLNNHGLSINMLTVFGQHSDPHYKSTYLPIGNQHVDHLSVDISGNTSTNTQPSNVNQHED